MKLQVRPTQPKLDCSQPFVRPTITVDTVDGSALILKNANGLDTARLHTHSPHEGVPLLQTEQ
jgi:hypothetical protein